MPVHASAIVDPAAAIHPDAEIGPFCVIGAEVHIEARTRLMAHVYCEGPSWIGEDNLFFPYSTVGVAGQDLKYKGERAETHIAYVHVAHDVRIGSHCVLSNAVTFGGHVTVGDWAWVGASSGVHQFCRIGRHAIIGGYSVITQDVLPFSNTVTEREAKVFGANRIGLERRGFSSDSIEPLQTAFRLLTRAGLNTSQAVARIREEVQATPEIEELLDFIATSTRGVIK
jgi:UDP-N-acetylglucosamine acyltransferase